MSSGVRQRKVERQLEFETEQLSIPEIKEKKKNKEEFTSLHLFISLSLISLLSFYSLRLHYCLPQPELPNEDNTRFSEIRAKDILHELSDYGPKPSGSFACEELTRNRILKELHTIQSSASESIRFDVVTQNPSGCFSLPKFDTDGFTMCYKNVSNVVARIGQKKNKDDISVLLNCHYDSWPTASGGSDDLISCALMLELLRILSHQPDKLKHDIIFLFNGAEESSLLAAHGFITQHPWRHSIRAFVNLEASGSGGRELLFQAGPSNQWLLNSYLQAAIHPHCSILGQEIFQSGVYPGDTDFRIFRDYGRIPGLDLAFVQNGYWWHTEFDEAKRITSGSLQRAGDNVLSTVSHLLSSPYLSSPAQFGDQKSVFYDVIGLFVVVYPLRMANIMNCIVAIISFLLIINAYNTSTDSSAFFSLYTRALFWNISLLVWVSLTGYALSQFFHHFIGVMLWYSAHYMVIGMYAVPIITSAMFFLTFMKWMNERNSEELEVAMSHTRFSLLSIILLILTYYNIASSFLIFILIIPVFLHFLVKIPIGTPSLRFLCLLSLLSLPALSMLIYTSEMLLSIFIPIMGRTSGNPEPVVMAFVLFGVLPVIFMMTSLSLRSSLSALSKFTHSLLFFSLILFISLYLFNSEPFNYVDKYPTTKRTQFFHVNRRLHSPSGSLLHNNSLIYAISQDYRGAEDIPFVNEKNGYKPLDCIYSNPYCEIPLYFPTRNRIKERHIRQKSIDSPSLSINSEINLKKKTERGDFIDYSFNVKGSPQMSLYLTSLNYSSITNCSLCEQPYDNTHNLFLFLTCSGTNCGDWDFEVTLSKSSLSKPLLFGASSHFLHGPDMQSEQLQTIQREIAERRQSDNTWAITASGWNVDLLYEYF